MSKRSTARIAGAVLTLALPFGIVPLRGAEPGEPQRPGAAREMVSRPDAQRMRQKAVAIEERGALLERPRDGVRGAAATTIVTEREVNSYLAYDAASQIPVGVVSPRIRILGEGRLSGTALVDLDAVRLQRRDRGWLDPMSYLTGQLPVVVSGRLETSSGAARFMLESATISGVPIPRTLVQELLAFYSRTPEDPDGLSLDEPFPLPARIHRIEVRPGEALVVQQ